MLVIRLEIWPKGDMSKARILSIGTISNTGQGSHSIGEYRAIFDSSGLDGSKHKEVSVGHFKRLEKGVWELLYLDYIYPR